MSDISARRRHICTLGMGNTSKAPRTKTEVHAVDSIGSSGSGLKSSKFKDINSIIGLYILPRNL
eukprot:1353620-Amorphochlora_amoeboformis.AAC.1